jgi:hypothetical protein
MPKIIKHGDRWPQHQQDWIGKRLTCGNCGCLFEILEGDEFSWSRIPGILKKKPDSPDRKLGEECTIEIKCPECSSKVCVNWNR